jgi:hypothetical protein
MFRRKSSGIADEATNREELLLRMGRRNYAEKAITTKEIINNCRATCVHRRDCFLFHRIRVFSGQNLQNIRAVYFFGYVLH